MAEALVAMTEKSFGCVGVINGGGRLIGVITDGDLRRNMGANLLEASVDKIMTPKPKTISPSMLTSAALELINSSSITALFVVEKQKPVGHHPYSRSAAPRRRVIPPTCQWLTCGGLGGIRASPSVRGARLPR